MLKLPMANKHIYHDLFNEKVDEFFKDLISAFPHLQEFISMKSCFTLVRNVDPKSPQTIFKNYVLHKYRDAILSKDEAFFMDTQTFEMWSSRKEYWGDFINHLKSIWKTLSKEEQETIWRYFHVLVVLSDKCT